VPSTRRPTYRTANRPSPGKAGATGTGTSEDVISASKTAPAEARTGAFSAASSSARPQNAKPADHNVLSFPEPPGKRRKRNIIITLCVVAALVAGLLAAAVYSPVLAVRTVTVDGTRMLAPQQVQDALAPLQGKPLPQVDDGEVDRLLEPLVQVKSFSTEAHPPSELVVHIRERVPVALVKQGEQFLLVDVEGVQLGTTKDTESVSLPVIDGGAGEIGKELFQAITAVLGALPADVLARLSDASAKSADAVELKLVDGQTIVWGNASEKELKAKVLEALLKAPADPKNPVRVYDVSVPRHPVTR
jgi:cell division protein FtsQ